MSGRPLIAIGAAAAVISAGLVAMSVTGAPTALVVLQGVAGLVGLGLGGVIAAQSPDPRGRGAMAAVGLALAALAATLFFAGTDGVHRWIALGPVQFLPSAVALPILVWFAVARPTGWAGPAVVILAAAFCAAQPDTQAVGALFAAVATLVLLGMWRPPWLLALAACLIAGIVAAFAPPLEPVAYVEQVVPLALEAGPVFGLVAVAGLIGVPATILLASWGRFGPTTAAMVALWLIFCAASLSGTLPTPVIGFGLSWVLGFGLSLGLVAGSGHRRPRDTPPHTP
ncbi:hypothetical protein [Brevundimonas aveniformis]|uniref:hypothetical protein n=1 Tax=Brevundimonas aveniformis TaxID=370977 RepID=UPI000413FF34|nr:hypothetical protein [Brevundimonas aveniformis]